VPRLMSVAFTEQAVRDRTKTVTRRKGWWEDKNGRRILQPGDRLTLCRKVMGRKPGEPLVKVAEVEVVSVKRETLDTLISDRRYGITEMVLEGFPRLVTPREFVRKYFVEAQGMDPAATVTRIEWRYLDDTTKEGS
jgi:hypothetical protein